MARLNLGVLDVAYSDASGGAQTTGAVAEILEANYHVMQTFFDLNQDKIAQWLADDMAASIQDLVNGKPIVSGDRTSVASHIVVGTARSVSGTQAGSITYGADQKIEAAFREFLYGNIMQNIVAKVGATVSNAAMRGVNHRKKNPTASRPSRPAFVDTGLYASAFRAWVEQ